MQRGKSEFWELIANSQQLTAKISLPLRVQKEKQWVI